MGGFPNKAADCLSQLYIDQKVRCENEERKTLSFNKPFWGKWTWEDRATRMRHTYFADFLVDKVEMIVTLYTPMQSSINAQCHTLCQQRKRFAQRPQAKRINSRQKGRLNRVECGPISRRQIA